MSKKTMAVSVLISLSMLNSYSTSSTAATGEALYKQECSACHIAYPAKFLPVKSWKKIMANLDKHFGDSAELGKEENQKITQYLEKNGASGGFMSSMFGGYGSNDAPERITTSDFFLNKHHEINLEAAKNSPDIKSLSRCQACHTTAAQGDFDEDNVRVPGGLGENDD